MITNPCVIVTLLRVVDLEKATDHEVQDLDLNDSNARWLGSGDSIHFSTHGTWPTWVRDGLLAYEIISRQLTEYVEISWIYSPLRDASIIVNLIIKHHGYWLTSLIKNIVNSKKWPRREICLAHRPWIGGKGQPGKKLEGALLAGAHEMSMWPCDMSITPIASRFPHSIILHSLHG